MIVTISCPSMKSKLKRSVGRPKKSVGLDLDDFHDFNYLLKENGMKMLIGSSIWLKIP